MALAVSLIFVAIGAMLIWGVEDTVAGVDLAVAGWIGLLVGVAGLALAFAARMRGRAPRERRTAREHVVRR